jgi:hypothetical protein
MVAQFRQQEQGVGITSEDRVMPSGLRRRTTVPASRAAALTGAGALEVDQLALDALSDDDKAALLLDVLGQTAADRDIVSTISDGATGTITSITRIPRSTIALPPATTPVPAPVTPSGSVGQTPPPTTTEVLTAGGATALGIAAMLADKDSLLNAILPAGLTGPELADKIKNLITTGSLTGSAGTLTTSQIQAMGSEAYAQASGGELALGEAASASTDFIGGALSALGGISAVLGLLQGAQTGDASSIVQSVVSLYSSLASAANATLGTTLPTIGSTLSSIGSSLGLGVGVGAAEAGGAAGLGAGVSASGAAVGLGTTTGALAAELGAGLTAGIVLAPIAIGLIVKAVTDLRAAEVAKKRIATAEQDLKTVIPQAIEMVQTNGPAVWAVVNNPNSTPAELRAAYDKAKTTMDFYNTYDNYFKTGTGAYGMVKVPQLIQVAKQLEPAIGMLQLGMVRATDKLAGTALQPASKPDDWATTFGVDNNSALRPFVGSGLTDDEINQYFVGRDPARGQAVVSTPYGYVSAPLWAQIQQLLVPGHIEQGLKALDQAYGTTPTAVQTALGFGTQGGAAVSAAPVSLLDRAFYTALIAQIHEILAVQQATRYQDFTSGGA